MKGLTKRQREIVDYIEGYVAEKRFSPSYREIQNHFGFSSLGSVYNHIQSLKKKGILDNGTQQSRSVSILNEAKTKEGQLPLIGRLRGGMPIETFPQISMIALPTPHGAPTYPCYVLQVVGRELEEEFIRGNDLLVVQSKSHFEDSDWVVALVGGQTTFVKKAFHASPYLRLESENPEVQPMILREDHVQILGVVISLIRHYRASK